MIAELRSLVAVMWCLHFLGKLTHLLPAVRSSVRLPRSEKRPTRRPVCCRGLVVVYSTNNKVVYHPNKQTNKLTLSSLQFPFQWTLVRRLDPSGRHETDQTCRTSDASPHPSSVPRFRYNRANLCIQEASQSNRSIHISLKAYERHGSI